MPRTYNIPYQGPIPLSSLRFKEVDPPERPQELEERVNASWQKVLAKNPKAHPGKILSVREVIPTVLKGNKHDLDDVDLLIIEYGMTTYDWFVGTANPDIEEVYRHTATAVCVVIITADNNIFLHLRGRDMAYRRLWHVPGGMLSEPDPVTAIKKEIEEELGIPFTECPEPILMGIACDRNPGRMNHELCFRVQLPITVGGTISSVRRRHAQATSKDEGLIVPVLNARETIEAFLEMGDGHAEDVWVPTGHAALVLHGRSMGWWQDTGGFPKLIAEKEVQQ